jgi:hypothetical protein
MIDGAKWVMEGVRGGSVAYAIWALDSPDPAAGEAYEAYRDAALYLLDVAGLRPDDYVY